MNLVALDKLSTILNETNLKVKRIPLGHLSDNVLKSRDSGIGGGNRLATLLITAPETEKAGALLRLKYTWLS